MSIALATLVAAVIFGVGVFILVGRRPVAGSLPTGISMLLAAAIVELAAVSRFAASARDALSGQEFAVAVALIAPALAFVASRTGESAR